MNSFGEDPLGATPLELDDYRGFKMAWVTTRAELDFVEASNIINGLSEYAEASLSLVQLLDDLVVRNLHKAMFGEVWDWAGQYRTRDLNIGVSFHRVAMDVANLMEDAKYWFGSADPAVLDESAARLHYRLVFIHPFLNGNGRFSRNFTDLALVSLGQRPFTWGGDSLNVDSPIRRTYINALIAADGGNLQPLLEFVRSEPAH
jgi:Fic-DOC domain mobile mystery protein B